MNLLEKLQAADLNVRPFHDWETRTNSNRDRAETVGILNHWDAIKGTPDPAYYTQYPPHNSLRGDLYHIVIRRNGLVDLLGQRYAWHAGIGDPRILAIAQAGGPIPDDQPMFDFQNGNPHFFSVSINYHPDEGNVPGAQYDALVRVNAVLVNHFSLNVGQVARHMDWTMRKRDIDTIDLATFRDDVRLALDSMASPGQKLVVDLAFNLFPEEVQGDPNFWKDLPEDDPQWQEAFAPALSRGAQNLYSRSKSHPTEFRVKELIAEDPKVVRKGESVVIKGGG